MRLEAEEPEVGKPGRGGFSGGMDIPPNMDGFSGDGGASSASPVRRYLAILFAVAVLGSFAAGLGAGYAAQESPVEGSPVVEVLRISN